VPEETPKLFFRVYFSASLENKIKGLLSFVCSFAFVKMKDYRCDLKSSTSCLWWNVVLYIALFRHTLCRCAMFLTPLPCLRLKRLSLPIRWTLVLLSAFLSHACFFGIAWTFNVHGPICSFLFNHCPGAAVVCCGRIDLRRYVVLWLCSKWVIWSSGFGEVLGLIVGRSAFLYTRVEKYNWRAFNQSHQQYHAKEGFRLLI